MITTAHIIVYYDSDTKKVTLELCGDEHGEAFNIAEQMLKNTSLKQNERVTYKEVIRQ